MSIRDKEDYPFIITKDLTVTKDRISRIFGAGWVFLFEITNPSLKQLLMFLGPIANSYAIESPNCPGGIRKSY